MYVPCSVGSEGCFATRSITGTGVASVSGHRVDSGVCHTSHKVCREMQVVNFQQSVIVAQEKVRHEEALLQDGVSRLAALKEESERADQPNSVPPTAQVHFATELAMLREWQELLRERDDLRAELATVGGREENRPKKTRTLANPSPDLMITDQELESMINRAESTVRANSSRSMGSVGEASHPGPLMLNFGRVRFPRSTGSRFTPLTEMDTVEDVPTTQADDEIQATPVAEGPLESDTETAPSLGGGDGSDVDGHSDVGVALEEVGRGRSEFNKVRRVRGWKLFLLLPRLLCPGARGGKIPRSNCRSDSLSSPRSLVAIVAFEPRGR